MPLKFPQIPMHLFYKLGSILFGCSALGSAINIKMQWETLLIGSKISMFATFFFQLLLVTLFLGFYFSIRNQPKVVNNPELDKFLEELKKGDKNESVIPRNTSSVPVIPPNPKSKKMKGGK